jgi:hypothetical protein
MMGTSRGRFVVAAVLSASAASVAAITSSAAVGSPGLIVPPADSFSGHITFAAGKFNGDRGRVAILLEPHDSGAAERQLALVLDGRRCGKAEHCIQLAGVLKGTLTRSRTMPDVGASFTIAASGLILPLGHVSATGSVHGTGFIDYGHEPLHLTLSMSSGSVALDAESGEVPGFTSP